MIHALFLAALATCLVLLGLKRCLEVRAQGSTGPLALVRSTLPIVAAFTVAALVFSALSLYVAGTRGETETMDRVWSLLQWFDKLQKVAAALRPSTGVALIVGLVLFALSASLAVWQQRANGRLARLVRIASSFFARYSKIVGILYVTLFFLCSCTFFAEKFDESAGGELRLRFKALQEKTRKAGAGLATAVVKKAEEEARYRTAADAPPEVEQKLEREIRMATEIEEFRSLMPRADELGVQVLPDAEPGDVGGEDADALERKMRVILFRPRVGPSAPARAGPRAEAVRSEGLRIRQIAELAAAAEASVDRAAISTQSLRRLESRVEAVLQSPERRAGGRQSLASLVEIATGALGDLFPVARELLVIAGDFVTEALHEEVERRAVEPMMRKLMAAGLGEAEGALEDLLDREAERLARPGRVSALLAERWPSIIEREQRVELLRRAVDRKIKVSMGEIEVAESRLIVRREAALAALNSAIDRMIDQLWPERPVGERRRMPGALMERILRRDALNYRDELLAECRSERLTSDRVRALEGLFELAQDASRPLEERLGRVLDFGQSLARSPPAGIPIEAGLFRDPTKERARTSRKGVAPTQRLRSYVEKKTARRARR